jgi:hypothetical protein
MWHCFLLRWLCLRRLHRRWLHWPTLHASMTSTRRTFATASSGSALIKALGLTLSTTMNSTSVPRGLTTDKSNSEPSLLHLWCMHNSLTQATSSCSRVAAPHSCRHTTWWPDHPSFALTSQRSTMATSTLRSFYKSTPTSSSPLVGNRR